MLKTDMGELYIQEYEKVVTNLKFYQKLRFFIDSRLRVAVSEIAYEKAKNKLDLYTSLEKKD